MWDYFGKKQSPIFFGLYSTMAFPETLSALCMHARYLLLSEMLSVHLLCTSPTYLLLTLLHYRAIYLDNVTLFRCTLNIIC